MSERAFRFLHQKNVIQVDLHSASLSGIAEITVVPLAGANHEKIHLNARQIGIFSVSVNGLPCEYQYKDIVAFAKSRAELVIEKDKHPIYVSQALLNELMNMDCELMHDGEVMISLPPEVIVEEITGESTQNYSLKDQGSDSQIVEDSKDLSPAKKKYKPFKLNIEFRAHNAVNSLYNVRYEPQRKSITFAASENGMARYWMPCCDHVDALMTWDFTYLVQMEDDEDLEKLMVVSSGKLIDHSFNNNFKRFSFEQSVPVAAVSIAMAVGAFDSVSIKEGTDYVAFAPVGRLPKLSHTITNLSTAFDFYQWHLNFAFPFSSYYLIFVPDSPAPYYSGANISIISGSYLHDQTVIDKAYEVRPLLGELIAKQYFTHFVSPATWSDYWIVAGISYFLSFHYTRIIFGNNEFRLRLAKEMELVGLLDTDMPPICDPNEILYSELKHEFIKKKAALLFIILEQQLSKVFVQKILFALLEDVKKDLSNAGVTTYGFLRTVKKLTGKDLKVFADQWIYGTGVPKFISSFSVNKKRSVVELNLKQTNSSVYFSNPRKFKGSLTIRVHEAEGVYDHIIQLDDIHHYFELPIHTRYRRYRRKKRMDLEVPDGDEDRMQEEDAEDEDLAMSTPVLWIRLDPEIEWIKLSGLEQSDLMWIEQLENDKDVIAQYEAVMALERSPSDPTCFCLERIVMDPKCYYGIRMHAAFALSACAIVELDYLGAKKLIEVFIRKFCFSSDNPLSGIAKPNNFELFHGYFVKKALIIAMSLIKDENGLPPIFVLEFLVDLLKYNDNSKNAFSDCYYVASLINAIAESIAGNFVKLNLRREFDLSKRFDVVAAIQEIERYRSLDIMFPSYQNVVTIACINAFSKLEIAGVIDVPADLPFSYSSPLNYLDARLASYNMLAWKSSTDINLMKKLLETVKDDDHKLIREFIVNRLGLVFKTSTIMTRPSLVEDDEIKSMLWGFTQSDLKWDYDLLKAICQLNVLIYAPEDRPIFVRKDNFAISVEEEAPTEVAAAIEIEKKPIIISIPVSMFKKPEPSSVIDSPITIDIDSPVKSRLPKIKLDLASKFTEEEVPAPPMKTAKIKLDLKPKYAEFNEALPKTASIKLILPKSTSSESIAIPATTRPVEEGKEKSTVQIPAIKIKPIISTPKPASTEIGIVPTSMKIKIKPVATATSDDNATMGKPPATSLVTPKLKLSLSKMQVAAASQSTSDIGPDLSQCKQIVKKILAHKAAIWFKEPVDPVKFNIHTYFDVIQRPMDFGTINKKLVANDGYKSVDEFVDDALLVFSNCYTFNGRDAEVCQLAALLEEQFRSLMRQYLPNVNVPPI